MAGEKKSFAEDIPLLVSVFLREFLAVALLLVLESRVANYDFMNKPLVLFLILITVRLPYINSYVYLFEVAGIHKWKSHSRHGSRSDAQNSYYFHTVFFLFVVAAHILAAVTAAAARVYFDVQYGVEIMSTSGPMLKMGVSTDVANLRLYDSMWYSEDRYACFVDKGLNGTQKMYLPFTRGEDYCLTVTNIQMWYIGEEAAYVFLLCICFVHLWLGTGVKENKAGGSSNPFGKEYWEKLFKLSIVLTLANMALYRAFPTAHGSFHNTIYNHYYQLWTPGSSYIDQSHSEFFFRVVGGLFGAGLGLLYNQLLSATQDSPVSTVDPSFFKLMWGFPKESGSGYKEEGAAGGSSVSVYTFSNPSGCPEASAMTSNTTSLKSSADFKLRIPYSFS